METRQRHHLGTMENPLFPGLFERASTSVGGSIRAAELATILRFSGGLHVISSRIAVESELDTAQLADNAVTSAKIGGNAVTGPKIDGNAVDARIPQPIDQALDGMVRVSDGVDRGRHRRHCNGGRSVRRRRLGAHRGSVPADLEAGAQGRHHRNQRAADDDDARRLQLSRTTVQSRIERLQRSGVIAGYTVRLGEDFERDRIRALVMVTVLPKQMPAVVEALRGMPEVRSLRSVSGPWDLVARVVVPTIGEMDELTDRIGAVPGVERTTSSLVLSTKFER